MACDQLLAKDVRLQLQLTQPALEEVADTSTIREELPLPPRGGDDTAGVIRAMTAPMVSSGAQVMAGEVISLRAGNVRSFALCWVRPRTMSGSEISPTP